MFRLSPALFWHKALWIIKLYNRAINKGINNSTALITGCNRVISKEIEHHRDKTMQPTNTALCRTALLVIFSLGCLLFLLHDIPSGEKKRVVINSSALAFKYALLKFELRK